MAITDLPPPSAGAHCVDQLGIVERHSEHRRGARWHMGGHERDPRHPTPGRFIACCLVRGEIRGHGFDHCEVKGLRLKAPNGIVHARRAVRFLARVPERSGDRVAEIAVSSNDKDAERRRHTPAKTYASAWLGGSGMAADEIAQHAMGSPEERWRAPIEADMPPFRRQACLSISIRFSIRLQN